MLLSKSSKNMASEKNEAGVLKDIYFEKIQFLWKIENLKIYNYTYDGPIESSILTTSENNQDLTFKTEWKLRLTYDSFYSISIIFKSASHGITNIQIKPTVSFLSSTNAELFKVSTEKYVAYSIFDELPISFLIKKDNLMDLFDNKGTLTVFCDIDIEIPEIQKSIIIIPKNKLIKYRWCKTRIISHNGSTLNWIVNDRVLKFATCPEICSPIVTTEFAENKVKWKLQLVAEPNCYKFQIIVLSSNLSMPHFIFTSHCFLANKIGQLLDDEVQSKEHTYYNSPVTCYEITALDLFKCASPIIVICNLHFINKFASSSGTEYNELNPTFPIPVNIAPMMYENMQFSDVVFKVRDGRILRAHKFILVARSSVFRRILCADEAKHEVHIEIDNFDYNTMDNLLRYIYTNDAPHLDQLAESLLEAAHTYDLKCLSVLCQTVLISNLKLENSVQMLKLANKWSADQLKKAALDCIITKIVDSEDLKAKITELPTDTLEQLSIE